jgi:ABC-type spermidine/putrescine transport system permease subunit I
VVKFILVFLVLLMVIAINLPQGAIAGLGFDANYLIAVLTALVIAGLVSSQKLGLIVVVVCAAIAANVPREVADSIGYNRDIMLAVLIALVILPFVARQF